MSDIEIVGYTEWLAAQLGIGSRAELKKEDPGLIGALWDRNLMDETVIGRKIRDWSSMGIEELVEHAKAFIVERGISGRKELNKADSGLYQALRRRKLLDEVGLPDSNERNRDWAGMEKDELVAHAKGTIAERGITGRKELEKADLGLYQALRKRKLLDGTGLQNPHERYRDWAGMGKERLIAFAIRFIEERGIVGRKELQNADKGLYNALRERGLLGEAGLLDSRGQRRDWAGMEKDELVAHAKRVIADRGITRRKELEKADAGLGFILRKMNLLDEVGLPTTQESYRDWARIGREDLVALGKEFITERGITKRIQLEDANKKLYRALNKRKLLDAVFSDVESSSHKEAVEGVLDALESFGDDG